MTQIILLIAAIIFTPYVNKFARWYWFLAMGIGFYFLFFGNNHDSEGYTVIYGFFIVVGGFVVVGFIRLLTGKDDEKKDK